MSEQNALFEARGPLNLPRSTKSTPTNTPNDSSLRETARKTLLKDLDGKEFIDNNDSLVYSCEQLAQMIEEEVYEITGKNCKNNKLYRDKVQKYLHNRLTGSKNSIVRISLLTGKLSVKDLCGLDNNQLEDDEYFNKLLGKSETVHTKTNRPPNFNASHRQFHINRNQTDTHKNVEETNLVEDYFNQDNSMRNEQNKKLESLSLENNENRGHNNFFDEDNMHIERPVAQEPDPNYNIDEIQNNVIPESNQDNRDLNIPFRESRSIHKLDQDEHPNENPVNEEETDNNNPGKNSDLYKEISELKIGKIKLEKDLEIERNQIRLYINEVKELREINTELRLKHSNINEESHQLEIQKLNNNLLIKEREIALLEKEKIALREQLNNYEKYFKNIFEKYRNNEENENTHQSKDVHQETRKLNEEEIKHKTQETVQTHIVENLQVETNYNLSAINTNLGETPSIKLPDNHTDTNTNEILNPVQRRERTNSHLSSNENKENTKNVEKTENLNEKKVLLPPPKVSDSYKIQSKSNTNTLSNRVNPKINPPKLTSKDNKNEVKVPPKINTNIPTSNPFFDEEPNDNTNQLFSTEPQRANINNNTEETEKEEIRSTFNKHDDNGSHSKAQTEQKLEEPQIKEKTDQGVISAEKQSPITTKTNNFFDDDETPNDFLNNSHVQTVSNSKPLNINPKILTPNRDVKKTLTPLNPPIKVTQTSNEKTNNFFDDGEEATNNLFSTSNQLINTNKNRINIPHTKVSAPNRVNFPQNKKNEKPVNHNTSVLKNMEVKAESEKKLNQTTIQDPFNFHQANENDFDNIFDSLSSSSLSKQKNENKNKKNNYFDD